MKDRKGRWRDYCIHLGSYEGYYMGFSPLDDQTQKERTTSHNMSNVVESFRLMLSPLSAFPLQKVIVSCQVAHQDIGLMPRRRRQRSTEAWATFNTPQGEVRIDCIEGKHWALGALQACWTMAPMSQLSILCFSVPPLNKGDFQV